MTQKRRAPAFKAPADKSEEGDLAMLEGDGQTDRGDGPGRVERRDWRGEGVVSTNHTD